jgi:hypothetical protein
MSTGHDRKTALVAGATGRLGVLVEILIARSAARDPSGVRFREGAVAANLATREHGHGCRAER